MVLIHSFPSVHFGIGAIKELGVELASRGIDRPLIITDAGLIKHGVYQMLLDALPKDLSLSTCSEIPENPTIAGVEAALKIYKAGNCNGIIALGGGSVLDSGKVLRIATNQADALIDYLKDPDKISKDVAPYITVPTTAGTGAEITFGAGIHTEPNAPGLVVRHPNLQPDLAICDPDLTLTLPPRMTAATGMDALTHCVEGYLSTNYNTPTKAIALDGIHRVVTHIQQAFRDGSDKTARANMLMAALEGGMAIYMGLGPIHALSNVFGDSSLHHGTLVAITMPTIMRFYNGLEGGSLENIAEVMGLPADADAGNRIADRTSELNANIGLPENVRQMGYDKSDIGRMVEDAHTSIFNQPAPKIPTREDYEKIVPEVLGE